MQLDEETRLELRDAIEASVVTDRLSAEQAGLLKARVAEDDAANWNEYVTLEDDERELRARRRIA